MTGLADSHRIGQAIEALRARFEDDPGKAVAPDSPATARVEGLRATATGDRGTTMISDMPEEYGGSDSAPSPGWFLRAAVASCEAMAIAMRASSRGVELSSLEVTVGSESDARGVIGTGEDIPAGPLSTQVDVRIGSKDASAEELEEIVRWATMHSPLTDALERAIPTSLEIEVAKM